MSDSRFVKVFSGMIGGLIALAVVLFFIANAIGGSSKTRAQADDPQAVAERIRPVGRLRVAAGPIMKTLFPAAQADTAKGKSVYEASCSACHAAGVAGAPKLGDKAAWEERIAQGIAVLEEHAIKGFQGKTGFMPPKGGAMHLSDADVKAAVAYMVGQAQEQAKE